MSSSQEAWEGSGHVLLAGLPADIAEAVAERMRGVRFHPVERLDEAVAELDRHHWDLLVVEHDLPGGGPDYVRRVREHPQGRDVPILYCVHSTVPVAEARHLVASHRVTRLLFHPLDPDAVADQISSTLPEQDPVESSGSAPKFLSALAGMWEKYRGVIMQRVATLQEAAEASAAGTLSPELRHRAEHDAHKLAGILGTFGFMQCSDLARSAELLLRGTDPPTAEETSRLSEWVTQIREQLASASRISPDDRDPVHPPPMAESERPRLLVFSSDQPFVDRVQTEAAARGMETRWMDADQAPPELAEASAAIVDLSSFARDAALRLLDGLAQQKVGPTVLAVSEQDTLQERVEVARRGARGFFPKPVPAGMLLDRAEQLLARGEVAGSKVLVVEDDGGVRVALEILLETRNIDVVSVGDAEQFWSRLQGTRPDLVVMDLDVADVRGEELCRTLRMDGRWQDLPVLFLASAIEPGMVQRMFAAGANDFVRKPFVGPEMLSRIVSHLERARLLQSLRERAGPIGLPARSQVMEEIARLLQIAGRQGESVVLGRIDLDHFAGVNRSVGPFAADEVMRQVAILLQTHLRAGDVVGWWGGDEFVVAMYATERDQVVERLNQVREAARTWPIELNGEALQVTFSAGVAQFPMNGQDFGQLSGAAEVALRMAKDAGGNRVVIAGGEQEMPRTEVLDVLLVDEDDALAEQVLYQLDVQGLRARWIRGDGRALELLTGAEPALFPRVILLDVDPVRPDGLGVLRELAGQGVASRSRVIVLTVHPTEREMLGILELGAADYLPKPFSIAVLLQRVWGVLQRT